MTFENEWCAAKPSPKPNASKKSSVLATALAPLFNHHNEKYLRVTHPHLSYTLFASSSRGDFRLHSSVSKEINIHLEEQQPGFIAFLPRLLSANFGI